VTPLTIDWFAALQPGFVPPAVSDVVLAVDVNYYSRYIYYIYIYGYGYICVYIYVDICRYIYILVRRATAGLRSPSGI